MYSIRRRFSTTATLLILTNQVMSLTQWFSIETPLKPGQPTNPPEYPMVSMGVIGAGGTHVIQGQGRRFFVYEINWESGSVTTPGQIFLAASNRISTVNRIQGDFIN